LEDLFGADGRGWKTVGCVDLLGLNTRSKTAQWNKCALSLFKSSVAGGKLHPIYLVAMGDSDAPGKKRGLTLIVV